MRERWGFWLKRLPTADSESLPTVLVAAMPRWEKGCQEKNSSPSPRGRRGCGDLHPAPSRSSRVFGLGRVGSSRIPAPSQSQLNVPTRRFHEAVALDGSRSYASEALAKVPTTIL